MKKFITRLLQFSLVLYAVALAADLYITRPFKPLTSSPFGNWNDMLQKELESDLLIMGSSRAFVQINPEILDSILHVNTYNLGCDGRPVDAQIVKYNIYRHYQHKKPKVILYELYPGSLDSSNGFGRIQYIPYLQRPYFWWQARKTDGFSWADCVIPCWRYLNYKQEVAELLADTSFYQREENTLYKGFRDFDLPWDGSKLAQIDTIYWQKLPQSIRQFEDFLSDCQQEDIRVIFVLAPYYTGALQKIYDPEGMFTMFRELAERHDCPVLDYFEDELCYDTTYFYNATHLNRTGATLFSRKLAHDLETLIPGY